MKHTKLFSTLFTAAAGVAIAIGSIAIAETPKEPKPAAGGAGQAEFKLPPGWTEEDMKACMLAGMPGKMHERLAKSAGVWKGTNTLWFYPGADPVKCDITCTIAPIMEGRYVKAEYAGEMPGMGPYSGLGTIGFDNVSEKFVGSWIDNKSTGIMNGTGVLSPDGNTLTWTYTYNCPMTKKPAVLREVEKITGADTKTFEMFGTDVKSGKEFQMMRIELTRKADGARAAK